MKDLFLFIALLFISSIIAAQDVQQQVVVEKSINKVKIGDAVFYVHIVKQHETLYSISKAYNVSQSEIATANPDIYSELKVGQALKIPVKDQKVEEDERYIYHIVKRRETIYSLTKMYGISEANLIALNPVIKDGLKKSQVVLIPRQITTLTESQLPDSMEFKLHEVQNGEGLYAISRLYGVSPRDVEYYNRDILVSGLKPGATLRIPTPKPKLVNSDSTHIAPNNATEHEEEGSSSISSPCFSTYRYDGSPFNVSLLMPFTQVSLDNVNSDDDELMSDSPSKRKNSSTTQSAIEFYEGFLLALDSMKSAGVSVNLSVFDTKKQPVEVNAVVKNGKLAGSHLIISPFFIDEILPVAKYALANGINMVSPSYNGPTLMPNSNNIITVNQSFTEQFDSFIRNLELADTNNYIVVYDAADSYSSSFTFCDSVIKRKFAHSHIRPRFYNHRLGRNSLVAQDSLFIQVDTLKNNVVIVPSEDEPFVSEMLSNIYGVKNHRKVQTQVFGPAKWRRMKNISPEYLYNLNLYIYTPFFVDYSAPGVRNFVEIYREIYRAEPSKLSFLGYDIGLYFISALKRFGPQFNTCLPTFSMTGLQVDFSFRKNSRNQNLHNTDQIIVKYTDLFGIERVN